MNHIFFISLFLITAGAVHKIYAQDPPVNMQLPPPGAYQDPSNSSGDPLPVSPQPQPQIPGQGQIPAQNSQPPQNQSPDQNSQMMQNQLPPQNQVPAQNQQQVQNPPPAQNMPPVQNQMPAQNVPLQAAPTSDNFEQPIFQNPEGYHYDPTGRRDPFKPFGESQATQPLDALKPPDQNSTEPLQMFDISQYKLLGIIWQVKDPKAMVQDPNGRTHLIRKQVKIGRNHGFVAAIREGEVVVVEPSVGESGLQTAVTRIMNLK